ncbi:MAG: 16S rRNA (adenine(1518)-N(6)/adenine(1519)-N(6))-dimethyltransferase RsmA [Candidatus Paceibacterota bacterium]|jgi:16S rRNA (adenine1518-N6/adenine1519-N6)-dimethyltransferase
MKAKKTLGQNWLKSKSAIKEMIKSADLHKNELVLEIGPGQGILTEALFAVGARVIAVEKDNRLIEFLSKKFANQIKDKQFILIYGDILKTNFSTLLSSFSSPKTKKLKINYKLIANIPYYITGQVIRKFLSEEKIQPTKMVLMLQKEVARRIVARDEKESLLSLSVKTFGEPKYIKTVPSGAFVPKPKVDSAILLIHNISRNNFQAEEESRFFDLLRQGFSQKRKKLGNHLKLPAENWQLCNLNPDLRAEDLKLPDWLCLLKTKRFKN